MNDYHCALESRLTAHPTAAQSRPYGIPAYRQPYLLISGSVVEKRATIPKSPPQPYTLRYSRNQLEKQTSHGLLPFRDIQCQMWLDDRKRSLILSLAPDLFSPDLFSFTFARFLRFLLLNPRALYPSISLFCAFNLFFVPLAWFR
ncbi:hypothetical protein L211DRAFT_835939 [Terfezia boudieri ATCC MYA-4762]|uniref:Uncharacterized protein n=1 Tax=Terfezia boudieri ATCC MYA-4762 TaxID=1051890 RepID=A0A3N4LXH0_9PEZI|nr:hypothetical protein L211DRAFT_835939 [Terfezia boudieri ATCC MYA-4762]